MLPYQGWITDEPRRDDEEHPADGATRRRSVRQSHFSRATRAFNRMRVNSKKKKPRSSRTTELATLENDNDEDDDEGRYKRGNLDAERGAKKERLDEDQKRAE